jgi:hypothetical protein
MSQNTSDASHNNQTKEQAMKVFGSVSILAMMLL